MLWAICRRRRNLTTTIYCLQKYRFFYYDEADDENVEIRYLLGYFNSPEKVKDAIEVCKANGISDDELRVETFELSLSKRQRYLYILTYAYSILNAKEEYTDYDYVFEPKTNRKQCLELKGQLEKQPKYRHTNEKIYDPDTMNGFYIARYELNQLYSVIDRSLKTDLGKSAP